MEEESLRGNNQRIKFELTQKNDEKRYESYLNNLLLHNSLINFANALKEMEEAGAAPILPDGKVGGNGGFLFTDPLTNETHLFVSQSGKTAGELLTPSQFCVVEKFDKNNWSAEFLSSNSQSKPTSDTPLLWVSLMEAWISFQWEKQPKVALHGHALADPSYLSSSNEIPFPISEIETLFSTREDLNALESLFQKYSYPSYQIFIRRGHGFFLLAEDLDEALLLFRSLILPHIPPQNSSSSPS